MTAEIQKLEEDVRRLELEKRKRQLQRELAAADVVRSAVATSADIVRQSAQAGAATLQRARAPAGSILKWVLGILATHAFVVAVGVLWNPLALVAPIPQRTSWLVGSYLVLGLAATPVLLWMAHGQARSAAGKGGAAHPAMPATVVVLLVLMLFVGLYAVANYLGF